MDASCRPRTPVPSCHATAEVARVVRSSAHGEALTKDASVYSGSLDGKESMRWLTVWCGAC